jgi:hypothetical protein
LVLVAAVTGWSQQLLVFPAITDELPGLHGSLWVTNVRLVAPVVEDEFIVVRRAWVALEGGGFEDDPETGLRWFLHGSDLHGRAVVVPGGELLGGAGDLGAVGMVVEGREPIAHAYVADVRYGDHIDDGAVWAFGQGQLIPAIREPLVGPSHIPWLGGCLNNPCSQEPPERWDYLRNNIGLVNPNPEPMTIVAIVIPFGYSADNYPGGFGELYQEVPETFTKTMPGYGWLQFRWEANTRYTGGVLYTGPATNGFIVSLTPDSDRPYYAYASVVFTPDPESGGPEFNDPMFVPAEPGFVAPWSEDAGAKELPREENR